jgi:hypothetical protein
MAKVRAVAKATKVWLKRLAIVYLNKPWLQASVRVKKLTAVFGVSGNSGCL